MVFNSFAFFVFFPTVTLLYDLFYDIQHLNRAGAETFTTILMTRIAALQSGPR